MMAFAAVSYLAIKAAIMWMLRAFVMLTQGQLDLETHWPQHSDLTTGAINTRSHFLLLTQMTAASLLLFFPLGLQNDTAFLFKNHAVCCYRLWPQDSILETQALYTSCTLSNRA